MTSHRLPHVLLLGAALVVSPAESQEPPTTSLSQPDRVSERGFTELVGVKELRDGRVILLDKTEARIVLLGRDLDGVRVIGRTGSGPKEYSTPSQLLPLVGDSSAVRDLGNARLLLLGPDAEPFGVLNWNEIPGRPLSVFGGDNRGRIYLSRGGGDRRILMRWAPPSPVLDTITSFSPPGDPGSMGTAILPTSGGFNPFAPTRAFTVGPGGTVAVVYPEPYRVELITAEGIRREGPTIPFDPVEVTEEHKEEYLESRSRPRRSGVGVVRGSNTPVRTSGRIPLPEPTWPKLLPPFLSQYAAMFATDGRLWVRRTTPAGDPPLFDVFDSNGVRVQQVTLPVGRRLLGFGNGTVYAVVRDELDLEHLERYSLVGGGQRQ